MISREGMLMHYQTNHTKDFSLVHWAVDPDGKFCNALFFLPNVTNAVHGLYHCNAWNDISDRTK